MNYSDDTKRRILEIRIVDILAHYGKRIDYVGYGNSKKFHSPFRDETSPSFAVNMRENTWFDHGEGKGGGLLDLIARLEGCSRSQAWEKGAALIGHIDTVADVRASNLNNLKDNKIIIDQITDFDRWILTRYANERGIMTETLRKYCRQIIYHYDGQSEKRYYAIGFPNSSGGWVLRSKNHKRSSKSGVTYISSEGKFCSTPSSGSVMVFEGFFDFLSYVEMHRENFASADYCVLNSVTNLMTALPYLLSHDNIGTWLDNDDTGRKFTKRIIDEAEHVGKSVKDMSSQFSGHNDLNEMLSSLHSSKSSKKSL